MTKPEKNPTLVVLQLSGGNDYMNTVIPFTNPHYYDNRPKLGVSEDDVLKLSTDTGLHPSLKPLEEIYNQGNLAIVNGVGWSKSNRSHFRCMDIWHTAEPDSYTTEGWLGKAARQLDPTQENRVTVVNIGQSLPRSLMAEGVSVASVSNIDTHGLLSSMEQDLERKMLLNHFAQIYSPAIGRGPTMEYLSRTGINALSEADQIKEATKNYTSNIEYANNTVAQRLRDVAKIHLAGLGTRILYTEHGGFDTHCAQATTHPKLWQEVSTAIADFWEDLYAHNASDNVIMLVFSEFGRRVKENGGGTDHGAAGVVFVIGPNVSGGLYGEYPEIRAEALVEGDLAPTVDFRSVYSSIIDDWMCIDPNPVLGKNFEKLDKIIA